MLYSRNYITSDDVSICAKVVLSTASIERVAVIDILVKNRGKATLSEVTKVHPVSRSTVLKTMTELKALGIEQMNDVKVMHNETKQVVLMPEFEWLLGENLSKIMDEFKPVDFQGPRISNDTGLAEYTLRTAIQLNIERNKVSNVLVFAPEYVNVLEVNLDLITRYLDVYKEFITTTPEVK